MADDLKDPQTLAEEYLRKHHITELFEDLTTAICFHQPDNVENFIVQQLKTKKQQGYMTGIFGPEEIENVFKLMDLRNSGSISKEQCKDALKSLASSEFQWSSVENDNDIPDKVDINEFKRQSEKILGIKKVQ